MANAEYAEAPVGSTPKWPVVTQAGPLQVRVATTPAELAAAQRLRYHVFYEEMTAVPTDAMRAAGRDFDRFDDFADQLLVVDTGVREVDGSPKVVGTYRLLRDTVAAQHGGFYTSSEYDIDPILAAHPKGTRFLELGRSCVLKAYRAKPVSLQLLWRGIVLYLVHYNLDVFFGCASFPGTDPDALAVQLSYLHHFHRSPEGQRARALPELYVEMNRVPKEAIDERAVLRTLPPLIKGYVRAGSYIGDGAVIDRQFDTTDVLVNFPFMNMHESWRTHFLRPQE